FFQAEDGIRDFHVTGVQTCALPISYNDGSVDISPDFTGQDIKKFEWKDPDGNTISTTDRVRGANKTGTYTLNVVASNNCTFSTRSEETRLNSSHVKISYAVFCLKKK